jgi:hypothetical protein
MVPVRSVPSVELIRDKVLAAGGGLKRVRSLGRMLKPEDEVFGVLAAHERIFARRFDIAAPARIAYDINDGGPEGLIREARVGEGARLPLDLIAAATPEARKRNRDANACEWKAAKRAALSLQASTRERAENARGFPEGSVEGTVRSDGQRRVGSAGQSRRISDMRNAVRSL